MIYDSLRVSDAAHINSVVCNIRTRKDGQEPIHRSIPNLKHLISFMSNETCERFLSYSFVLPYVPWRGFNGLTINQMVSIFNVKETKIRNLIQDLELDRIRVSYTDLFQFAASHVARPGARNNHLSDILVFKNGTRLDETGSSYYLVNPRGILYVVVALSDRNDRCYKVLELLYDSVCRDDDWIVTQPIVPPSIPLIAVEGPDNPPDGGSGEVPKLQAEPAPEATPGALETALSSFIKSLKPGTEIRIVVPA